MKTGTLHGLGKWVAVALATLALSFVTIPATAFAVNDVNKVYADATQKDVSVEVGNVSTDGNPGVKVIADNEHTATVKTGSITAIDGQGVIADATGLSTIEVTTGAIKSTSDSGIEARVKNEGAITVTAGDIQSGDQGAGIWTSVDNTNIVKDGVIAITAGNVAAEGEGIVIRPYSLADITVTAGNVTARENGVEIICESGAKTTVSVNDVTSDKSGMFIYLSEGSEIDAFVTGTLSGEKAPISFFGALGNNIDAVKLAVWKIALNDGTAALQAEPPMEMMSQAVSSQDAPESDLPQNFRGYIFSPYMRSSDGSDFEKSINYIMKTTQPSAGGTISVTDENGNALTSVEGPDGTNYQVANQDNKVLLKVNLEDGYRLVGAYNNNGENQVELLKDGNGNYYIVVPKGGGINLSVALENDDALSVVNVSDEATTAKEATATKAASTANADSNATLPKTGDSALMWVLLCLSLLSGGALALAFTKCREY